MELIQEQNVFRQEVRLLIYLVLIMYADLMTPVVLSGGHNMIRGVLHPLTPVVIYHRVLLEVTLHFQTLAQRLAPIIPV